MLTDKEKEEFRRKIKSEIEQREKVRLEGSEGRGTESSLSSDKTELKPPRNAVSSEGLIAPIALRDNISGSDWIEIERLKNQAEEEWYSSHPDYTYYLDRTSNKKWIHKAYYEKKMARDKAREDIEAARRKNLIMGSIGLGLFIILSIMSVYYFFVPKYECAVSVESNIKGAAIFIDGKRTKFDTDAFIYTLTAGEHQISIYKPGFTTGCRNISVEKGDTAMVSIDLEVDPKYMEIQQAERPDSIPLVKDEPIYTPGSAPRSPAAVQRDKTSLFINSNVAEVLIKVDGKPTAYEVNRVIDQISEGSHIIELEKPGYRSEPAYAVMDLQKGANTQYISFELLRENPLALTIRTEPVDGDVFIDEILMGHGQTIQEYQIAGNFRITFGNVRGFKTPIEEFAQLSERDPSITIIGRYLPIIDIMMTIQTNGQVESKGVKAIETGYYYPNTGGVPSQEFGPELKKLASVNQYAYELGYAFGRRNPPGSDYIELVFDLPENYDKNKVLNLTLRGAGSEDTYLLNLTKQTDTAVEINGRTVADHYKPMNNIDKDGTFGNDTWLVSDFLRIGENRVMIRTTEANKCYYYLHKIEIK